MFTFRHLEVFIAVAEELHFGRAAARLGIGQPPLSQQIKRLETELSVTLLRRTKRKVELTDAGRAFLIEARAMTGQAERARLGAVRAARGEIGTLDIGIIPTADNITLMRAIRRFCHRYPQVKVSIHSLSTAAQVAAIHRGEIQVGFVRLPVRDDSLDIRPVLRESLIVAMPAGHVLARRRTVPLRLLAKEPFVLFPRYLAPDYYDSIISVFYAAGLRLDIAHESEHVQTILGLVLSGFGVSVLPQSIRSFSHRGVIYRPLAGVGPFVETGLVFAGGNNSSALRAFCDTVTAALVAPARARPSSQPTPRRYVRSKSP